MQESLHPDCCCFPRQEAATRIEDGRMKRHSVPSNLTLRGGRPSQGYFARRIYPDHTSDMGLRDLPCQLNNLCCAVIFRSNKWSLFQTKQVPFIMWSSRAEEEPLSQAISCRLELPSVRNLAGNSGVDAGAFIAPPLIVRNY